MSKMTTCEAALLKSIDRYLAKADDDLKDTLGHEGFADAGDTVDRVTSFEDEIAGVFTRERRAILRKLKRNGVGAALNAIDELEVPAFVTRARRHIGRAVQSLAETYLKLTDRDLKIKSLTKRTSALISEWADGLAEIMELSTADDLDRILSRALRDGKSVADTTRELQDAYTFSRARARRTALTEMLTAHSAAASEAYMQSPVVVETEWKHTGARKNNPRANHVAMNGTRIKKGSKFNLRGADGRMYHPAYPRDPSLPASERVNCHCIAVPIVSKDALGLDIDERRKLQRQAVARDNKAWERELDRKNRAKAGIDERIVSADFLEGSYDEQVKLCGGRHSGRVRVALLRSGVIDDATVSKLYTTAVNSKGRETYSWKPLKELKKDGIMIIENDRYKHITVGEYTPKGKFTGGGHSQTGLDTLKQKGVPYTVTKTLANGVRIGTVTVKGSAVYKAWFPRSWTDEDILEAAIYVANNPTSTALQGGTTRYYGEYKQVKLQVSVKADGTVSTAFPDY